MNNGIRAGAVFLTPIFLRALNSPFAPPPFVCLRKKKAKRAVVLIMCTLIPVSFKDATYEKLFCLLETKLYSINKRYRLL